MAPTAWPSMNFFHMAVALGLEYHRWEVHGNKHDAMTPDLPPLFAAACALMARREAAAAARGGAGGA